MDKYMRTAVKMLADTGTEYRDALENFAENMRPEDVTSLIGFALMHCAGELRMLDMLRQCAPIIRQYAARNPKHMYEGVEQDPMGAHAIDRALNKLLPQYKDVKTD